MMKKVTIFLLLFSVGLMAQDPPELACWILSDGVTTGKYYTQNGDIVDTGILSDVQEVYYTDDVVYVIATGVPSYLTGPFLDGNPGVPDNQDWQFEIPRNPVQNTSGNLTGVPLGAIGVLINGTLFENFADAMSWNNQGVWNRNANVFELDGFDCMRGHPQGTAYHHHQNPVKFNVVDNPESDICDQYPADDNQLYVPNPNEHSPIIGYSFDGFPLYGPYGYADPLDPTSGIRRIKSSYDFRDITERTVLPDGTVAPSAGPNVNAQYPIGSFKEDFEYVGNGDLDEHNGRFCITPDYPEGIYAYFTTEDDNGHAMYPFFIGPEYYGVVEECNFTAGDGGGPGGPGDPPDCEDVPPGAPCCGDGFCGGPENADNCPEDCGGKAMVSCDNPIPDDAVLYVPTPISVSGLLAEKLSISPNPSNGVFLIDIPVKGEKVVSLYNATGQIVYTKTIMNETLNVELNNAAQGVYLLSIEVDSQTVSKRVVIR